MPDTLHLFLSSDSTPPAARLVGIETNPGPGRGKRAATSVVAIVPAKSSRAPRKRRNGGGRSSGGSGLLELYKRSLLNAFMASPPRISYNTFGRVGTDVLWSRNLGVAIGGGATSFAAIFQPYTNIATAGAFGTGAPSWLKIVGDVNPDTTLAASANQTIKAPQNTAVFNTVSDTHRCVTASVRVTVRYPMTAAPGRLFAVSMLESDNLLSAQTFNSVAALDASKPISFDGSGVAILQGNWRPQNGFAFEFSTTTGAFLTATNFSKMVIVGLGWTAGQFSLDVDAIAHVEYNSGVLAGGDSSDSATSLLDTPIEKLSQIAQSVPTVLNKADLNTCQAVAMRGAMTRHNQLAGRIARVRGLQGPMIEEIVADSNSSGAGDYLSVIRNNIPGPEDVGRVLRYAGAAYASHVGHQHLGRLIQP